MIRRRAKRLVWTYAIVLISLFAFTSCEEDSEIFDNVEIKQETDNEESKGSSVEGN